jgi:hypothetical protein
MVLKSATVEMVLISSIHAQMDRVNIMPTGQVIIVIFSVRWILTLLKKKLK